MNLTLRPATADDQSFLMELYASSRVEELAGFGWDDNQKQAFIKMQFLARERTHPQADDRIIVLDGCSVGRMMVDRSKAAILLRDIALLPEHRNAGIGSLLLQGLMKEAALDGKSIELHVVASSPAVRLYERLGFRRSDAETAYETAYLEMHWVPARS